MKIGHGRTAFSRTSIECRRGCIDMLEAHFHIKTDIVAIRGRIFVKYIEFLEYV